MHPTNKALHHQTATPLLGFLSDSLKGLQSLNCVRNV
jgi:hypothetical protein